MHINPGGHVQVPRFERRVERGLLPPPPARARLTEHGTDRRRHTRRRTLRGAPRAAPRSPSSASRTPRARSAHVGSSRRSRVEPWTGVLRRDRRRASAAPQDPLRAAASFRGVGPGERGLPLPQRVHTGARTAAGGRCCSGSTAAGSATVPASQPHYDGGPLAERGDVVVVTHQLPRSERSATSTSAAHGGDDWGAATNAGQLDQIAALRWVHDNIAALRRRSRQRHHLRPVGRRASPSRTLLAMPAAQRPVRTRRSPRAAPPTASATSTPLGGRPRQLPRAPRHPRRRPRRPLRPRLPSRTCCRPRARAVRCRPSSTATPSRSPAREPCATAIAARHPAAGRHRARRAEALRRRADRPEIDDAELERQVRTYPARRAADRAGEVVDGVSRVAGRRGDCPPPTHDIVDAVATAITVPHAGDPAGRGPAGPPAPRRSSTRSTGSRRPGAARSARATASRSRSCSAPSAAPATTA